MASALCLIIAEPRRNLVARALEEAAVVASAARVTAVAVVGGAVFGTFIAPSRTLIARVVTVICHRYSSRREGPAECRRVPRAETISAQLPFPSNGHGERSKRQVEGPAGQAIARAENRR